MVLTKLEQGRLRELWYGNGSNVRSGAYGSPLQLYMAARASGFKSISKKDATDWLNQQPGYLLNRKKKVIQSGKSLRHYVVSGMNEMWMADLLALKRGHYPWALIVIDAFSRFAWGIPISNKKSVTVVKAFRGVIDSNDGIAPRVLLSDRGSEFFDTFAKFLASRGIRQQFTKALGSPHKAAMAERLNRTIRMLMARIQSSNRFRSDDGAALTEAIKIYNHKVHSSIGRAPASVTAASQGEVLNFIEVRQLKNDTSYLTRVPQFKVGDFVRRRIRKEGKFMKESDQSFSNEVYIIQEIKPTSPFVSYVISDLVGFTIDGSFTANDLVLAESNFREHRIPSNVRASKFNPATGSKEVQVHFQDQAPGEFSWISEEQLQKYRSNY